MPADDLPLPDDSARNYNPFDDFINHELDLRPIEQAEAAASDASAQGEDDTKIAFNIPQEVIDSALERYQARVRAFVETMINDTTSDDWREQLETREREIVEALKVALAREVARRERLTIDDLQEVLAQSAMLALLADRQMPPVLSTAELMPYLPDDPFQEDDDEDDEDEDELTVRIPPAYDPRWRKGRIMVRKDLVIFDQPEPYSKRTIYENARWRLNRDVLFIPDFVTGWAVVRLPHHQIAGFIPNGEANLLDTPRVLRLSGFDLFVILSVIILTLVMLTNADNLPFTRSAKYVEQLQSKNEQFQAEIADLEATIEALRRNQNR